MRIVVLTLVSAGLVSAGAALAVGPPQPPQPVTTTSTTAQPTAITATAISATGLRGYVSVGPIAPNCAPGDSCFRPARVTLRFWRRGVLVATAASVRASGAYRIALAPGVYTVSVPRSRGLIKPSLVRVPVDRWKRVNFVLSTGIY